jgi:hypothetical protein
MGIKHTFQSTVADASTATDVRPTDWNANHTIDGTVTFAVNASSSAHIILPTSGALMTTATVGAIETDANCLYYSPKSSERSVVRTEQFIFNSSAYTGTTAGTAQKMFDASTGLAGAVTVGPSVSYMFETAFNITGRSTLTHIISYGFGGTAAIDRITFMSQSVSMQVSSVPTACLMARCTVNNSPITVTNTSSHMSAVIHGRVTIGTSGTIIPQITRSASVVALVITPDAYFRIWPIGTTAVTRVGHWS